MREPTVELHGSPLPHDPARAREDAGIYESDAIRLVIAVDDTGMTLAVGTRDDDGTVIGLNLAGRPAFRVPWHAADPMTFSDSNR
jgi:hypothetical protein